MPPKGKKKEAPKEAVSEIPYVKPPPTERELKLKSQYVYYYFLRIFFNLLF